MLQPILGPIETALCRLAGVDAWVEQKWSEYAVAFSSLTPSGQLRSIFSSESEVCCRSIRNSFS
jgi:hypothetical protein